MGCASSTSHVTPNESVVPARIATFTSVSPTPMIPPKFVLESPEELSESVQSPIELEVLKRLETLIMEMSRGQCMELTSIVAREGSGEEPGTLTRSQIPLLYKIPGILFTMVHLTELNLRCNQLRQVPKDIQRLSVLEILNLSENQLTELPSELMECRNLRILEIGENHLTKLPDTIGKLTQLEILRANRNQLVSLPDEMETCHRLQILNLYNNVLTSLGNGIEQCGLLQEVTVSNNRLTVLPSMTKWRVIKSLYLQCNQLVTLPSLDGLSELELLQAFQNQLLEIPSMENMIQLKKIDLHTNRIHEIPVTIGHLPLLQHFNLRKNQLTAIPSFLGKCRTLEILDFGNNPIVEPLPPDLGHLSQLKSLLLDGTKITRIPIELMTLHQVIRVYLSSCLELTDQETVEVVDELRTRCKLNGGWLKLGM